MFNQTQDQSAVANRRHTLRIARIDRRDATRIVRSRGCFEMASLKKTKGAHNDFFRFRSHLPC